MEWLQNPGMILKYNYAAKFKNNKITILACTNAFGMGIDKPNIRYTIHMNLPQSIEAFYQEAGRAGRDRKHSECCIIVSNDYPQRSNRLLDPSTPLKEISEVVNNVKSVENDDITRAMYFHVNSFIGAENELSEVKRLIAEIGYIDQEKVIKINTLKTTGR